jgi:hypothetical protein
MSMMDITNQMYQAKQASWDKMFYNSLNQEEEENIEDEGNDGVGTNAVGTAPTKDEAATAPGQLTDPKAPTETAKTPANGQPQGTEDPKAPQDPMAPTDTPPSGNNADLAGRNVIESQELMGEVIDIFENRKSGEPTGRSDIMTTSLIDEAQKRGLKAEIIGGESASFDGKDHVVGGTVVITGQDGKRVAFTDTNGDGAIGLDDQAFAEAVQKNNPAKFQVLEQKTSEQSAKKLTKADGSSVEVLEKSVDQGAVLEDVSGGGSLAATAPTGGAATGAQAAPQDPAAAIGTRIGSGEEQTKADGSKYKYQVQDCDLNKCPRGRPACTGCGQCIKAELKQIEKDGGSIAAAAEGMNAPAGQAATEIEATDDTAQAAPAAEAPKPEAAAPQEAEQQVLQKVDVPKATSFKAKAKPEAVNEQDATEALKQVQAYLDSYGFADKTAEELLADGQLDQIALQLGIQLPENLYK